MRIFKTKIFARWAKKEGLKDQALTEAVAQMENGLAVTALGGNVFKKRIALPGQGKSGSTRTIVAYKNGEKAFFVYGFAKNERSNIKEDEVNAFKLLAKGLLSLTDCELANATEYGALIEVLENG